jgi:hypothetical protein
VIHRLLVVTEHAALGDVLLDRFQALGLLALVSPPGLAAQRLVQWGNPHVVLWDVAPAKGQTDLSTALAFRDGLKTRPPLLLLLPEGGSAELPKEEAFLLNRPIDFETLADAVEQFAEHPRPDDPPAPSPAEVPPLTAEVLLLEAGRARIAPHGVRVRNLDLEGARFESPVDYAPGAAVALRFQVPGETVPLRLRADVRWSQREGNHAMVDCSFRPIASRDLGRLEKVLAACPKDL